ncbi:oligosaccharide repeat unit polymerase [Escherichia coli]|nr:oligosaccharide repeat unit polymerase [Escherichia coli]
MNKINIVFITLLIIEIVVGGGGRLLEPLGIPSLRYIIFAISLVLFIFNTLTMRSALNKATALIMIMLFVLPIYGAFVGSLNGNLVSDMAFDLKPFAYMLILLYVCTQKVFFTKYSVECFINVTKIFSVIASSLYILYIVMLKAGIVNFTSFYNTLSLTSEFFFRPSGAFFAKSFFFIGIGAILFFIERRYFLFLLSVSSIFLTETRGVFLFTGVAVIIASLRTNGAIKNSLYICIAIMAAFSLMVVVGDRAGDSDSVRLNDFEFIMNQMGGFYSIFGHGFGSHIIERVRIEIVPLEIFYKTGIIGIVLSIIPLYLLSINALTRTFTTKQLQIVCALIFSAGVSITNPFLYTPMGIFVIAIAINSNKYARV